MNLETKILGMLIILLWGMFGYMVYYDLNPLKDLIEGVKK